VQPLPQAGIIAQVLLEDRLGKYGYSQSKIIPGLWTHKTRPILFSLVVDDFTVKYTRKEDTEHLLNALKKDYIATEDWEGTKYLGLTIEWNYENGQVHLWMPGYVSKALLRFEHKKPDKIQNSPHPHNIPAYGAKVQYAEQSDESPKLEKAGIKYVQQVAGTLLYYRRAVDTTILPALSYSIGTGSTHGANKRKSKTTVRLLCITGRGNYNVQCKQNDPGSSLRRRIRE
jgi:hypothetical protein